MQHFSVIKLFFFDFCCSVEMKDIASTSVQRERLAKYKDSIASAMQAQFSDILHEVYITRHELPSRACF